MEQKWVSVVGIVVVVGLSFLLSSAFSGDPVTEPISTPDPNPEAVLQETEPKQVEADVINEVHLRGLTARTATMTDVDGTVMPGIEYLVELELPRQLESYVADNRLEVRAVVSGDTREYLGVGQFAGSSFQVQEAAPLYMMYQVHMISYHSAMFDEDRLGELTARVNEDLQVSFYVDGAKVKDL